MNTRLLSTLDFIRKYWSELSMLYIDPDIINIPSYYDSEPSHASGWWSCMFASPMIQSFFVNIQDIKNVIGTEITSVDQFEPVFVPGNTYILEIMNHVFVLVYLDKDNVLYGDYFSETGRGRVSQYHGYNYRKGPNAFRLEMMSPDKILTYLRDYMNQDSEKEAEFHLGDQEFALDRYDSYKYYNDNDKPLPLMYTITPISKYLYSPGAVLESCWNTLYNTVNHNMYIRDFDVYQPTRDMRECVGRIFTYGLTDQVDAKPIDVYIDKYIEVADKMLKVVGCMDKSLDVTLVLKGAESSCISSYFDA